MTYKDLDSLAERLKRARELRGTATKTRKKSKVVRKHTTLKPRQKAMYVDNLTICKEAVTRAKLELDAVVLQAYKAGLSAPDISRTLGIKSHGYIYKWINRLLDEYKAGKVPAEENNN